TTTSGTAHLRYFLYLDRLARPAPAAAPASAWGSWPAGPPFFFFQVMVIFPPDLLSVARQRVCCPLVRGRLLPYYNTRGVSDKKKYFSFIKFLKRHAFTCQIFHPIFTISLQSLKVQAATQKELPHTRYGSPRVMILFLRW